MPFIGLTNIDGEPIALNTDHVLYAEPNGSRAKINFANGAHIRVQQTYAEVDALLPKYTVLEAVEIANSALPVVLPSNDGQPVPTVEKSPEQLAEEEVARKTAEQAELERQAEEARKNNKGNPAKERETK